ncbi:MAG: hypothetical protein WBG50_05955 [Desulfomonilaceae bacterium]
MFIVRFVLVVLLTFMVLKILSLVGRYLQSQFGAPQVKSDNSSTGIKEMVRDPVCGLYIPSDGAVGLIDNGKVIHFCSEKCRQKFINNQK